MTLTRDDPPPDAERSDSGFPHAVPTAILASGRRFFAAPPGASRIRRPTDVVLLVMSIAGLAFTAAVIEPPSGLDTDLVTLAENSPEFLTSLWQVIYDLVLVWSLFVVVMALVRRHFWLAGTSVGAAVLGVALAFATQRLALDQPFTLGELLEQLMSGGDESGYPAARLVAAAAVLVVASPALSRPYRFLGRLLLTLGIVAAVALQVSTFFGALGGLAAGAAAAAAAHLVAGSPGGLPTTSLIRSSLAELGVDVGSLETARLDAAGVSVLSARGADDRALLVKVYGRDAWDGQLLATVWRFIWYRDSGPTLTLSRLQQVEHEAFLTLMAAELGAPVPRVVTAGSTTAGDALLVVTSDGTPLVELESDEIDDATLDRLWTAMCGLHTRGVTHGRLDPHRLYRLADETVQIIDWSAAAVASAPPAMFADQAQLLASTAVLVGSGRAVDAAQRALGAEGLGSLIPYLQPAALTPGLRDELEQCDIELDDLRSLAVAAAGVDEPELVQLRRVTVGSVLQTALVLLAAWLLISGLSDIGLDTIVDELSDATWGWVLAALVMGQLARAIGALSTLGATTHPLRLGPTAALEFAISFVNMAVPSSAARLAVKLRYFQRAGMTITSASTMSAIDSLAHFGVQISIILAALVLNLGELDLGLDLDPDQAIRLIVVVAVLLVAIVAITFTVPSLRNRVLPPLRTIRDGLRVLRSPRKLGLLIGGNLLGEIGFSLTLGLALRAYGESLPIVELLVINTAVALFAGLMPVPGGIGVSEAALTAGLMAFGVPEGPAFATAITTRLCTFYLPPIWGWGAMKWLQSNRYL